MLLMDSIVADAPRARHPILAPNSDGHANIRSPLQPALTTAFLKV